MNFPERRPGRVLRGCNSGARERYLSKAKDLFLKLDLLLRAGTRPRLSSICAAIFAPRENSRALSLSRNFPYKLRPRQRLIFNFLFITNLRPRFSHAANFHDDVERPRPVEPDAAFFATSRLKFDPKAAD